MRYFDRNRKRLTKKQFVRGTLTSSNGENEATIEDSAGLLFESIEISGKTRQATYDGYNLLNKENFTIEGLKNETEFSTWAETCMSTENLLAMLKPNTTYTISYELEGAYDLAEGETFHNGSGFLIWVGSTISHWLRYDKFVRKGERVQYSASFTTRDDVSAYVLKAYTFQIKRGTEYPSVPIIIRNVQIVEDSTQKPYEPYVGGTYSPNPDYPQPIENANGEGVSVVLHGYNLFNKDTVTFRKNLNVNTGTLYNSATRGVSDYIEVDASKQYTIFRPYQAPAGYTRYMCCYDADKTFVGMPNVLSGNNLSGYAVNSFPADTKYIRLNFWYDAENSINESEGLIFYEGTEKLPHAPYFREEITIPTELDSRGEIFPLRLAGAQGAEGYISDAIYVKKMYDNVTYAQSFEQYVLTGDEEIISDGFDYGMPQVSFDIDPKHPILFPDVFPASYCNRLVNANHKYDNNIHMFDIWNHNNGHYNLWLCFPSATSADEVRSIIKSKYEAGDPFIFQFPIYTIGHDITRTDFGQALLNLTLPRTQSGIFTVESPIGVGGVSVEYYSMEKEDKVTLEVLCMTGEGEELKRTSKSVRRGTKYLATAPEIDGYIPKWESIFGVASADAQIIFEYTKADVEVG